MKTKGTNNASQSISGRIGRWWARCLSLYRYVTEGVWNDTRHTVWVNCVKTVNLSVRSFLNGELQVRAAALTYQTILAVVPISSTA